MPQAIVYVGDELSAAGFRLAGVAARVPKAGSEAECLVDTRLEAQVVLLGIRCAASIPPEILEPALASPSPLVMVVPDLNGAWPATDSASKVRRLLGVET